MDLCFFIPVLFLFPILIAKILAFGKMLVYRRFKFCTSGMLSYHKFINGHLLQRLARLTIFKRGEYDSTP